jgi:GTP-binding protein HflX
MNLLSKSDVFVENKLFATLDTTVRKVVIGNLPFLLSDTVGFIRKLPHDLVESFKSTLDEVRESDMLVHIVDISHPNFEEQIKVVDETLRELGSFDKPAIIIFNKIDAFSHTVKDEDDLTPVMKENYSLSDLKKTWMASDKNPWTVFISAKTKENVEELRKLLYEEVKKIHIKRYPFNDFLYETPPIPKVVSPPPNPPKGGLIHRIYEY